MHYLPFALFPIILIILIQISFYDLEHRIIPPNLNLALLIIGLATVNIPSPSILSKLGGAFMISVLLFLFAVIKENSFGGGDIKLFFTSGFLLGINGIIEVAMIAFISSFVFVVFMLGFAHKKPVEKPMTIAFGPFISIGIIFSYADIFLKG